MAAKFFTGLPLDGPDPECVKGHGSKALASVTAAPPKPSLDHSHRTRLTLTPRHASDGAAGNAAGSAPDRACDENPLAGLVRT